MKFRSWLIVPGNSAERLGSALTTGADVVVVDLEDTVPHEQKGFARRMAADWLALHRRTPLEQRQIGRWVRVNSLDSGLTREDLAAVMASVPDGIILPKAVGPESVRHLASEIYELEQRSMIPANSTRVIPVAGETPMAAMTIPSYLASGHQRLAGLTWSAAALANAISATRVEERGKGWSETFRFVRTQTLLAAHAGQYMAIEAPHGDFEDAKGVAKVAGTARADGFTGMFAIHPSQVAAINKAFTPAPEEIEEAREILAAFTANTHVGSLPFRGRMIDKQDLGIARRVLGLADGLQGEARKPAILRSA